MPRNGRSVISAQTVLLAGGEGGHAAVLVFRGIEGDELPEVPLNFRQAITKPGGGNCDCDCDCDCGCDCACDCGCAYGCDCDCGYGCDCGCDYAYDCDCGCACDCAYDCDCDCDCDYAYDCDCDCDCDLFSRQQAAAVEPQENQGAENDDDHGEQPRPQLHLGGGIGEVFAFLVNGGLGRRGGVQTEGYIHIVLLF
ncbi:hypothetical protein [Geoalkalibacter subterraneus]|uniref:hypothetical protein n=1 Tax=Geoalkalibacter subterraneus TaxID=483547 RepID=UPI000AFC22D2|nr:hypothetical protein [Geoalkalibacter subterraneus]